MTREVVADVPLLATKLRFGSGRWVGEQSAGARVLPQLAMDGLLVRGRPRGTWVSPQFRWVTDRGLARRADRGDRPGGRAGRAPPTLARVLRARDRDGHALVDGLDGARDARRARRDSARRGRPRRRDRLRARRRPRADARSPSRRRRCCRRSTRRRWAGRSATGTSARTRPTLFDSNGNAGPTVWWDGRVVGGWSQRRDGEIVYELLEDVGRRRRAAVEGEAERVAGWLGDVRFSPGFLPPFQRGLAI